MKIKELQFDVSNFTDEKLPLFPSHRSFSLMPHASFFFYLWNRRGFRISSIKPFHERIFLLPCETSKIAFKSKNIIVML